MQTREISVECLLSNAITFMYVPARSSHISVVEKLSASSQLFFVYQLYSGMAQYIATKCNLDVRRSEADWDRKVDHDRIYRKLSPHWYLLCFPIPFPQFLFALVGFGMHPTLIRVGIKLIRFG